MGDSHTGLLVKGKAVELNNRDSLNTTVAIAQIKKAKLLRNTEYIIQVWWCRYDERKKEFITVRERKSGGKRYF